MTCYVYVIAVGGEDGPFSSPIKIGMAADPVRRLEVIRRHSPLGVSLVASRAFADRYLARRAERTMHEIFPRDQLAYEWFHVEPAVAVKELKTIGDTGDANGRNR